MIAISLVKSWGKAIYAHLNDRYLFQILTEKAVDHERLEVQKCELNLFTPAWHHSLHLIFFLF